MLLSDPMNFCALFNQLFIYVSYLILVGEENETPFIRVWKPFPSRRVLKPRGKAQRGQYLLVVGLDSYKWYQSQTSGDVLRGDCFPMGGRHKTVC